PSGGVRIVGRFGVLRWDRLSWHFEPPVSTWIDGVTAPPFVGDGGVLQAMLEFAVHDLGSLGIGSALPYPPADGPAPPPHPPAAPAEPAPPPRPPPGAPAPPGRPARWSGGGGGSPPPPGGGPPGGRGGGRKGPPGGGPATPPGAATASTTPRRRSSP